MKARLILEDGTIFSGTSIGAQKTVVSEIVFNTSMTGYLEVLTDPSYAGQAITMTYPLIGNYGVTPDKEAQKVYASGYIVKEISRYASNFRCEGDLGDFLKEQEIPGICGIDTRALTKRLRDKGTMNGMITTDEIAVEDALPKIREYRVGDVVSKVTCSAVYSRPGKGFRVALLDLGSKKNIVECLINRDCQVTVFPAHTKAESILRTSPDGIMLSNGPGDPKDCMDIAMQIKLLCDSGIPVFAICLGHQLTALAHGGDTYKMKYGHRGGNHPVRDEETGRIYISSQNHGYVVDAQSLPEKIAKQAFVNVNDNTNEGLMYKEHPVFTVQFHPEASPGPLDSGVLFDRFMQMMSVYQKKQG